LNKTKVHILPFAAIDPSKSTLVGGKAARLGELARMPEIRVPAGFCITTEAFKSITDNHQELHRLLEQLRYCKADQRNNISNISANIREIIEGISIPGDIVSEIAAYIGKFGAHAAFAVRSSASAEDLPSASFAGQLDSFLNIVGLQAILHHIGKCWASLYTERAIIYHLENGFTQIDMGLSVIVQKMVAAQAAGILFTADPVSGNRKRLLIDAGYGLGEAIVSGIVNTDAYTVCKGSIVHKKISGKKIAVYALPGGGTNEEELEAVKQHQQVLTDEQIIRLDNIGRKIENHFGFPQDIEWCLLDDEFYILQSRPVTTLFPVPETNDQDFRVYISVGHQQMMTDAMKPLGLSFFLLTTRAPMRQAGCRLFVDITNMLAAPASRAAVINGLGQSDPLIKDALLTIIGRGHFTNTSPADDQAQESDSKGISAEAFKPKIKNDPALVPALIRDIEISIQELQQTIANRSGAELLDFILADIQQLQKALFDPKSIGVIMEAIQASAWINEKMNEWLGEINAADKLTQSVPNNITSEMGLALMDVADIIRPFPDLINYLQNIEHDDWLDGLEKFNGGRATREGIVAFLGRYGMRCVGEIDITRTRWREKPATILPVILSNIKNFPPNAGRRKFEHGQQEAMQKEAELIKRLEELPDGKLKAEQAKEKIGMVRNFIGYREYPKYGMVNRYWIYKQALLKEAGQLKADGIIREEEDIYYLSFAELRELLRSHSFDYKTIEKRKEEFALYKRLTPPRVITSEGEIITGTYQRDQLPADALAGLAVSAGVAEGRARVIRNMEEADLKEGDILVTVFTDPSWTPLLVSIGALVTEVGGLMTHGAVIAREYGLPAVIGVENATRLIRDGQRIRVHGGQGYVQLLD